MSTLKVKHFYMTSVGRVVLTVSVNDCLAAHRATLTNFRDENYLLTAPDGGACNPKWVRQPSRSEWGYVVRPATLREIYTWLRQAGNTWAFIKYHFVLLQLRVELKAFGQTYASRKFPLMTLRHYLWRAVHKAIYRVRTT